MPNPWAGVVPLVDAASHSELIVAGPMRKWKFVRVPGARLVWTTVLAGWMKSSVSAPAR
jgi:hypothetical protein